MALLGQSHNNEIELQMTLGRVGAGGAAHIGVDAPSPSPK